MIWRVQTSRTLLRAGRATAASSVGVLERIHGLQERLPLLAALRDEQVVSLHFPTLDDELTVFAQDLADGHACPVHVPRRFLLGRIVVALARRDFFNRRFPPACT